MSRHLIYVSFWTEKLEELVTFLRANNYSKEEVERIESLLRESSNV